MVSCEHGGNRVPTRWAGYFDDAQKVLRTHRGYDPGTLRLARRMARAAEAPLIASTITRLLVELNRSPGHRSLFSPWSQRASDQERQLLLRQFYQPYRERVERTIGERIDAGEVVVHVSVHSFTPVWEGVPRPVDVGFLYDPGRPRERQFCGQWKERLEACQPALRCRRNQPYRGVADGLTTYLRRKFDDASYAGIELEVSQGIVLGSPAPWKRLQNDLCQTLLDTLR